MQPHAIPLADWLVILPVLLPLTGAALLLALGDRVLPSLLSALLVVLVVGLGDGFLLQRVLWQGPVSMTMGNWLPPFGISFTADAAGATFALAASVVTFVVLLYATADPPERNKRSAFAALVLVLLAGVGGAFLTGDLFNLYVWFEVMLIASFGLLVLSGTPLSVDATVKYGLANFIATSLFLLALGLLYGAIGTLNMADIVGAAGRADPAVMTSIAALLLVAFGTKAAAFPVNTWLPASYHAPPAAVSALLGGLLTKVGVYALLRTLLVLLPAAGTLLHPALAIIAGLTLLLAPLGAIAETNLRRAIGFLLIGGIGIALVGIALPTEAGVSGAVVYVANAMLTIAALYLVAGLVEEVTGETDTRRMGGVYAASAPLSVLFLLLVVAIAGVPPFLGFWPKLLLLQAGIARSAIAGAGAQGDAFALPLAVCLLFNALLTLIAGSRLWSHIFWRPAAETAMAAGTRVPGQRRLFGLGAAGLLTLLVVAAGLWPEPLLAVGHVAASALLDPRAYVAATGLEASP
jgi:multicomponent Na+:H+ antiporter subunit D